jgi:hypothetical protein
MFDKERLSTYDDRPEYSEMPGSYTREKVIPPRRFWTRPKIISAVVIAILLLGGIVCIYQSITIQQRQYDIQGKIGAAWNEVDRASQLLQQDAALLSTAIASQNDAIAKIAQARSNVVTIKTGQGTGDTNAALTAANQVSAGIRAFVESYPDYGVGSNTHSVLVQILGSNANPAQPVPVPTYVQPTP